MVRERSHETTKSRLLKASKKTFRSRSKQTGLHGISKLPSSSMRKTSTRTARKTCKRTARKTCKRTARKTCKRNARKTCKRNARKTCKRNARKTCKRNARKTSKMLSMSDVNGKKKGLSTVSKTALAASLLTALMYLVNKSVGKSKKAAVSDRPTVKQESSDGQEIQTIRPEVLPLHGISHEIQIVEPSIQDMMSLEPSSDDDIPIYGKVPFDSHSSDKISSKILQKVRRSDLQAIQNIYNQVRWTQPSLVKGSPSSWASRRAADAWLRKPQKLEKKVQPNGLNWLEEARLKLKPVLEQPKSQISKSKTLSDIETAIRNLKNIRNMPLAEAEKNVGDAQTMVSKLQNIVGISPGTMVDINKRMRNALKDVEKLKRSAFNGDKSED